MLRVSDGDNTDVVELELVTDPLLDLNLAPGFTASYANADGELFDGPEGITVDDPASWTIGIDEDGNQDAVDRNVRPQGLELIGRERR